MDTAAQRGDVASLRRLKSLGAPLYMEDGPTPLDTAIYKGRKIAIDWLIANGAISHEKQWKSALEEAVARDNHYALKTLLQPPFLEWIDPRLASQLLTRAASNADPEIVKLMLSLGANPNGDTRSRYPVDSPLFEAANGIFGNAEKHSEADRRAVVRTLLGAGSSIVHDRYGACDSVLYDVSDAEIANMLLEAGADPDFIDCDGTHILFGISDEDVALLLISKGADLHATRQIDGMTLRQWAELKDWPRVIELLDRVEL